MEFWRGEAYTAYVDYLESTGGFYYEVSLPPAIQMHDSNQVLTHPFFSFFFLETEMG